MQASTPSAPLALPLPEKQLCSAVDMRKINVLQSMGPPAAHIKIKHSSGPIEEALELRIDKDSDFNQHSQFQPDHAGSFPFECYCGHIFHNQKNYRAHILDDSCVQWKDVKIRDNLIVCTCGVQFAQRGSLFRHLRTRQCRAYWPDGGRALVCLCGAKFNRRDNMMRHQKSPRCRQNCNRLGVTGNPQDTLPPTMRKVYPKQYRSPVRASRYTKNMAEPDVSDEEWVINARWKEKFGPSPVQRYKSEPTEPILSPQHHRAAVFFSGPPTPIDISSPINPISSFSPSSQFATPQPSGNPPSRLDMQEAGHQYINATAQQFQSKITLSQGGEAFPVHNSMSVPLLPTPTQSAAVIMDHGRDTVQLTPAIACRQDTVEDTVCSPLSQEQPASSSPSLSSLPLSPRLQVHPSIKVEEQELNTALTVLFPEIVDLMDRIKVPNPVVISRLVVETIDSVVVGFMDGGLVPQKNAALMCQTISAGVSQILLAKLRDVPDETFVKAVHQMDTLIYSRLGDPLKLMVHKT